MKSVEPAIRHTAMPAQLISHYRILGPLGSGGMGVVFKAEDTRLHRIVALKFVSERDSHNPKLSARLQREAQNASSLNHPNICTIYEVGQDAGEAFIAMEYVEGRSLSDLIREGPLAAETVFRYGRQITSALAHAHEKGVIHADLKPSNIIITPHGEAKILDFGLARKMNPVEFDRKTLETVSAESNLLGGTLPYMAPEQIEGKDASVRTDIWSFGIVLYEMVAGHRPFYGENLYLLCNSILRDPPRPIRSPIFAGLATIIARCLEKEPERRYRRAGEVRAALEALTPEIEKSNLPIGQGQIHWLRFVVVILALVTVLASAIAFAVRGGKFWGFGSRVTMPSKVLLGVLPPVTRGDTSEQAFDNGLAATLNSRLGELSTHHPLVVIPMNSTIAKGVTTVDAARQELGVNLVLLLDVQRAANNVRVNYALVDARSHQQVRSGTITADASDPFALQDRVFDSMAAALELQLAPTERQSITSHGTTEPAAYDYYIQGRGYLQDYVEPEKVQNAIMLFGRALEKDPSYAAAFAGLGEAYFDKYQLTHDKSWSDAAVLNCQKSVELGAHLASAYSCLARVFSAKGDYERAAEQYRRALEIEPNSDDAYGGLATAYEKLGRLEEAEKLYKQAISERPGYWATYNWLGLFYMTHARYEEAASMFSQVVSLAPDSFTGYYNLGDVRLYQGKYEEAIPLFERSLSIRPTGDALSDLGSAYFQMRRYADSAVKYEEAVKLDDKNYILWGNLGDAYYWTPGKRTNAVDAYGTAIALAEEQLHINSHDGQLLGALAEYHAMRGEPKVARDYVNRSLKVQPNNPVLLFNAGVVYQQIGESGRALDVLEQAVSLGISPQMIRDTPNFETLGKNQRFVRLVNRSQKN